MCIRDSHTGDLVMPSPVGLFSLQQMANGSSFENYYDPKLIYDPTQDRFVLVFLKDNDAANSKIIVCFSSTNDPADPWHVYRLDGNPLDNNRWTDFPAVALSELTFGIIRFPVITTPDSLRATAGKSVQRLLSNGFPSKRYTCHGSSGSFVELKHTIILLLAASLSFKKTNTNLS